MRRRYVRHWTCVWCNRKRGWWKVDRCHLSAACCKLGYCDNPVGCAHPQNSYNIPQHDKWLFHRSAGWTHSDWNVCGYPNQMDWNGNSDWGSVYCLSGLNWLSFLRCLWTIQLSVHFQAVRLLPDVSCRLPVGRGGFRIHFYIYRS